MIKLAKPARQLDAGEILCKRCGGYGFFVYETEVCWRCKGSGKELVKVKERSK